jgi:hypothetical protein
LRKWGLSCSIWNRNADDKDCIEEVSKKMKSLFSNKVTYQKHIVQIEKNKQRMNFFKERESNPVIVNVSISPSLIKEVEEDKKETNSVESETNSEEGNANGKKKIRRGVRAKLEKIPPLADPISDEVKSRFKEHCTN